jgi:hypothetical protein
VQSKQPDSKIGKRHFCKEDSQVANKPVKQCLSLLIIREMQIRIAMGRKINFNVAIRLATIKKTKPQHNKYCWGFGKITTFIH